MNKEHKNGIIGALLGGIAGLVTAKQIKKKLPEGKVADNADYIGTAFGAVVGFIVGKKVK